MLVFHSIYILATKNLSVTFDASSSGSKSGSSNRPFLKFSPLSPPSRSHELIQGYVGAPLEHDSHQAMILPHQFLANLLSMKSVSSSQIILNIWPVKPPPGTAGMAATRGLGCARRRGGESTTSISSGQEFKRNPLQVVIGLPSSDNKGPPTVT